MPYFSGKTEWIDEYTSILATIESTILKHPDSSVVILGDFNIPWRHPRGSHLRGLCERLRLDCVNSRLGESAFSFHGAAGGRSAIDHVIVSHGLLPETALCHILTDVGSSDHMPVVVDFGCSIDAPPPRPTKSAPKVPRVRWDRVTGAQADAFATAVGTELRNRSVAFNAIDSIDDQSAAEQLDSNARGIVESITSAAVSSLPVLTPKGRNRDKRKWFWASVQPLRKAMHEARDLWQRSPYNLHFLDLWREAKRTFRRVQRNCERREQRRSVTAACSAASNRERWRIIAPARKGDNKLAGSVDGVTDQQMVADLFAERSEAIVREFSAGEGEVDAPSLDSWKLIASNGDVDISVGDVTDAIAALHQGRAIGPDGIANEHLRIGGESLYRSIRALLAASLRCGRAPAVLKISCMTPIPKDRRKSIERSPNYRPIGVGSPLASCADVVFRSKLEPFFVLDDNQLGYRKRVGCDHAAFLIRETMRYYLQRGVPVYFCTLDASRAFERVCHSILWRELAEAGVPAQLISVLADLSKYDAFVRWGNSTSAKFHIDVGVRQGGSISSILFNIYMDALLVRLRRSGAGCILPFPEGDVFTGAIGVCDDISLLANSVDDMQVLLSICENFARERFLLFNAIKSACMGVRGRLARLRVEPKLFLSGVQLPCVEKTRHLGYFYSWRFSADVHVEEMIARFRRAVRAISSLPGFYSASLEFVKFLFEACSVPVILYGMESVRKCDLSAKSHRLLSSAWNTEIRGIAGLRGRTRVLVTHGYVGILPFELQWALSKISFCRRLLHAPGPAALVFGRAHDDDQSLAHSLLLDCVAALGLTDIDSCITVMHTKSPSSLTNDAVKCFFATEANSSAWCNGVLARELMCANRQEEARTLLYHEDYLNAVSRPEVPPAVV